MLVGQTFIGRQNYDTVQPVSIVFLSVEKILLDIYMHQERLSGTGRTPECQLVEVIVIELLYSMPSIRTEIEVRVKKMIDFIEESGFIRKEFVQVNLGEKQ